MPIMEITAEDGTLIRAWVCGRGLKSCGYCNRLGSFQCDFITMRFANSRIKRCDRWLCAHHATELGPDKHACPDHRAICLDAIARRLLKQPTAAAKEVST